ncbi:hypothetical protein Tco_0814141 [Tanacetum coccineum]
MLPTFLLLLQFSFFFFVAADSSRKIDLFADVGFSSVSGSFGDVSVLKKKKVTVINLLPELVASFLWAAIVVTMVFATSSITPCGGVPNREVMEGLPRCAELQRFANSLRWEEAMILYCRRAIVEDCKVARETNRLCGEVVAVVEEKAQFLQELDALPR